MKKFKGVDTECIKQGQALTTKITYEENLTVVDVKNGEYDLPWVQGGCTE